MKTIEDTVPFSTILASATSVLFGGFIFGIVTFSNYVYGGFLSFVLSWLPLLGGIYIFIELWPIISQSTSPEKKEKLDIVTTPFSAAMIWLVTPAVFITKSIYGGWASPNYWAWQIWLNSLIFPVIDLLLLLVLYRISRGLVRETKV